jgi:hypothetical protein
MESFGSRGRAGWAIALAIAATVSLVPSRARAVTAPPYTTSRYMQNVSTTRHYDLGCQTGTRTKNLAGTQYDLVILHYFKPVRFSDGSYGAGLLGGASAKTSAIAAAVKEFAKGYYICTGSDTLSQLVLAVGTSNDGSGVTSGHGKAWATMVRSINTWLADTGYDAQTYTVGASDMELAWNSPTVTRAWVDGFASVCCPLFYNYGDAAGCRADGRQAGDECGTGSFPSWTANDVWYISYGAPPAYPVPQIYRTDGVMAKQWYGLSLYARNVHGVAMWLLGSLTQSTACKQVGCDASTANTPSQGWTQLWYALNCRYFTTTTCPTAQDVDYSTDMSWTD